MFNIVLALHREPEVDYRAALLMELLKAMQPGLRWTISVKQLEKPRRPVALTAAPPVDLPRRLVDRALPNFDRQLK